MSYRKIYEALLAYEPKSLIRYAYKTDRGCCAVGVLAANPEALPSMSVTYLYDEDDPLILAIVEKFNCTIDELEVLQDYNDAATENKYATREERYLNVLKFLDQRVKEEKP